MRKRILLAAPLTLLLCLVSVSAQTRTKPDAPKLSEEEALVIAELMKVELDAELYALAPEDNADKKGAINRLAQLYTKVAASPTIIQTLVAMKWNSPKDSQGKAQTQVQWEYKFVQMKLDFKKTDIKLSEFGAEGWEVLAINEENGIANVYMKRPKL